MFQLPIKDFHSYSNNMEYGATHISLVEQPGLFYLFRMFIYLFVSAKLFSYPTRLRHEVTLKQRRRFTPEYKALRLKQIDDIIHMARFVINILIFTLLICFYVYVWVLDWKEW